MLNASVTEAVKRRGVQARLEPARYVYMEGDFTWAGYIKIRNETEGLMTSTYIPEYDDALEAGKLLSDFHGLWQCASVTHVTGCCEPCSMRYTSTMEGNR